MRHRDIPSPLFYITTEYQRITGDRNFDYVHYPIYTYLLNKAIANTIKFRTGVDIMARRKSKFTNNVEFINISFPKDIKAAFEKQFTGSPDTWQTRLDNLMTDGYRISVSYDEYHDCFQCSLSTRDDENVNTGKILTVRSGDWWRAVCGAIYAHYEIYMGEGWSRPERDDLL